jgi:hypothetical protein
LSKDVPIQEEVLAIPTVAGAENKECTAPTAGTIQKYFAAKKFPGISTVKIKEGCFFGSHIHKLIRGKELN